MRFPAAFVLALVCALAAFVAPADAQQPKRIALLIGNQGYNASIGPLQNPHTDIALLGAALKSLDFKVTEIKDADYRTMDAAIKRHIQAVRREGPGTISFVYYSGHGAADPDTKVNYLIPVDVANADDDELWNFSLNLNSVIDALRAQAPGATHYIVFDACRNELNLTSKDKRALLDKGFQPIPHAPGIMVAYATAPGKTATDAGSGGGPYAKALAEELVRPGIEAMTMFRNVALRVNRQIGQDPWISASTLPEFYFAREEVPKPAVPPSPPPVAVRAPEHECDRLAAHSEDPDAVVRGVVFASIEPAKAVPACEQARSQHPSEKRFGFQLSRAVAAAGDRAREKELIEALARENYAAALTRLGSLYFSGEGVSKNLATAFEYYRRAADAGHAGAMTSLGEAMLGGNGVTKDEATGVSWLRKAEKAGNPRAKVLLGQLYSDGSAVVPKDESIAFRLYREAVEIDPAYGCFLANMYKDGRTVSRDPAEAIKWFTRAAEGGCVTSMIILGEMNAAGYGMPRDEAKSLEWYRKAAEPYRKAAETGSSHAMLELARLYREGPTGLKDEQEAYRWVRKSADAGDAAGLRVLGYHYNHGIGVEKDLAAAAGAYRKSAEKGDASALRLLGLLHLSNNSGDAERQAGIDALRQAADKGDTIALLDLGDVYRLGRQVARNDAEAAHWYRRGMEAGHRQAIPYLAKLYLSGEGMPNNQVEGIRLLRLGVDAKLPLAMVYLGEAYQQGLGLPKNEARAFHWYSEAVELDGRLGCWLAQMYQGGNAVTKDLAEAARWFKRAAEDYGCTISMINLARMSLHGKGVPRDDAQAAAWLRKAAKTQGVVQSWADTAWLINDADFNKLPKPDETAALLLLTFATESAKHRERFMAEADNIRAPLRIAIQKRLKDAGHYSDALNGRFGPEIGPAIEAHAKTLEGAGRRSSN